MSETYEPGEWVKVWAQVSDQPSHPEDVVVDLISHNEHYTAPIRADRVEGAQGSQPAGVPTCTAMARVTIDADSRMHVAPPGHGSRLLVTCTRYEKHPKPHRNGDLHWTKSQVVGYFEES